MNAGQLTRFLDKIEIQANNCVLWTATKSDGYGMMRADGAMRGSHRLAYEHWVGPIPTGLQLDHKCRNRSCVNYSHLEPVTQCVNVLRGEGVAAQCAKRIVCKNGHSLEDAHVYKTKQGRGWRRTCRPCKLAVSRASHAKKVLARNSGTVNP